MYTEFIENEIASVERALDKLRRNMKVADDLMATAARSAYGRGNRDNRISSANLDELSSRELDIVESYVPESKRAALSRPVFLGQHLSADKQMLYYNGKEQTKSIKEYIDAYKRAQEAEQFASQSVKHYDAWVEAEKELQKYIVNDNKQYRDSPIIKLKDWDGTRFSTYTHGSDAEEIRCTYRDYADMQDWLVEKRTRLIDKLNNINVAKHDKFHSEFLETPAEFKEPEQKQKVKKIEPLKEGQPIRLTKTVRIERKERPTLVYKAGTYATVIMPGKDGTAIIELIDKYDNTAVHEVVPGDYTREEPKYNERKFIVKNEQVGITKRDIPAKVIVGKSGITPNGWKIKYSTDEAILAAGVPEYEGYVIEHEEPVKLGIEHFYHPIKTLTGGITVNTIYDGVPLFLYVSTLAGNVPLKNKRQPLDKYIRAVKKAVEEGKAWEARSLEEAEKEWRASTK